MRGFSLSNVTVCLFALLGVAWSYVDPSFGQSAVGVVMPAGGAAFRVTLAVGDEKPAAWDGHLKLSSGKVLQVAVQPEQAGTADGDSWKVKTRVPKAKARKSVHDPKLPSVTQPVLLVSVDAPETATVSLSTAQGDFSFTLGQLAHGTPQSFLEGRVRVERVPLSVRLTAGPEDEDLPAAAKGTDGAVWIAYTAYRHAQELDLEAIHQRREFDTLLSADGGDQVRLMKFDGRRFSPPLDVTEPGLDVWRPAVAVDGKGLIWVIWSQNVEGNWDLYARSFDARAAAGTKRRDLDPKGLAKATLRLTSQPGADINPVAVTDPNSGRVYVVWQGWRDGSFDILFRSLEGKQAVAEKVLASSPANEWCPAVAFDSKGTLHVAFDSYAAGNYDVKLVSDAAGAKPRTIDVAASPKHEAHPSIAVDKRDRIWVAYEEDGVNWGKDVGMRWLGRQGTLLYFQREIALRMVEGDRVQHVDSLIPTPPIKRTYPDTETRRVSLPRLAVDAAGRIWLSYRRHPSIAGGGELWISFLTYHTGDGWAEPMRLANSENIMDNRPPIVPLDGGGVLVVHSTDGRTGGTTTAGQNDLFCTTAEAQSAAQTPKLVALLPVDTAELVHPNETEDVRRLRQYRASVGGKTYQLLRGEFHRHTELTAHRDQDGTLEEMWRYGLDAAGMDWIGNGDHDNGYGVEYLWWLVQKQTDIYHHPPDFMPMFTYERSVTFPSGHRNAMFARRGVRPLPRIPGGKEPLYGTPEEGSPDIKTFYAYLKHFDGICASHTSGTNMGTDWRDNDPEVEPVVEIYQGLRHSYEHEGAPASAKGEEDAIGGYRQQGFIWNALMKGYRLGFEVSSDHYSTHISYAMVWAEEPTREGILAAFKKRHSYGANDNIILDVRCGRQMMGDEFTVSGKPTLEITAIGTAPIARLSIIRGVGNSAPLYVYDAAPNQREVRLRWSDQEPEWGKTNYYYVRAEQEIPPGGYGALAWASPMWIRVER